jgi:electron transfer flavoprotein beta subunit
MHAAVLLKPILDWELPPRKFRIDDASKCPPPDLAPKLLGPFEQNALELALQLKDAGVVEKVTAIVAGGNEALEVLKKALAVRADAAVLVELEQTGPDDPALTSAVLACAVERLDSPDLVLTGRQAGDWDYGQVGYLVAERLGQPAVGLVWRAERADGHLHVWRNGAAGVEKLAVRTPAVLTVTNHDSLVLRMSSVLDLMAANKKPIERWTTADLGLDEATLAGARRLEFESVWVPEVESHCEFVEGEDAAEVATALVGRLVELKLLGGVA